MRRRQAATPRPIVIRATTLAEFRAGAVARYGGLRRAAAGIGIPYSTLRGWLAAAMATQGFADCAHQSPDCARGGDLDAMDNRLGVIEQKLGCESDARVSEEDVRRGAAIDASA